jgi:hypothetical protein
MTWFARFPEERVGMLKAHCLRPGEDGLALCGEEEVGDSLPLAYDPPPEERCGRCARILAGPQPHVPVHDERQLELL